jgi:hypothetical protein
MIFPRLSNSELIFSPFRRAAAGLISNRTLFPVRYRLTMPPRWAKPCVALGKALRLTHGEHRDRVQVVENPGDALRFGFADEDEVAVLQILHSAWRWTISFRFWTVSPRTVSSNA